MLVQGGFHPLDLPPVAVQGAPPYTAFYRGGFSSFFFWGVGGWSPSPVPSSIPSPGPPRGGQAEEPRSLLPMPYRYGQRAVTQPSRQLGAPPARGHAARCSVPPARRLPVPRASCSCSRARLNRSLWSRRRPHAARGAVARPTGLRAPKGAKEEASLCVGSGCSNPLDSSSLLICGEGHPPRTHSALSCCVLYM
jgi:hypothetical protein